VKRNEKTMNIDEVSRTIVTWHGIPR